MADVLQFLGDLVTTGTAIATVTVAGFALAVKVTVKKKPGFRRVVKWFKRLF